MLYNPYNTTKSWHKLQYNTFSQEKTPVVLTQNEIHDRRELVMGFHYPKKKIVSPLKH